MKTDPNITIQALIGAVAPSVEAFRSLRRKQTPEIARKWEYGIAVDITHAPCESGTWTAGTLNLYRTNRLTGKVAHICERKWQDSNQQRRDTLALADALTVKWTAFECFEALLTAPQYRPSLTRKTPEVRLLADIYDLTQTERGNPNRAYRA